MSSLPVQFRPNYLPRISILLSTLESLVSTSATSSTESNSCSDLSWDPDHDYYIYSEEDDNTFYDLDDCVFDLPASGDERVIDLSVSGDECVIDRPTCNDDVDVASNGEYHNQMSPAAREVSQMFPAAMVSDLFPINKEMVVINESVTSSMTTRQLQYPDPQFHWWTGPESTPEVWETCPSPRCSPSLDAATTLCSMNL